MKEELQKAIARASVSADLDSEAHAEFWRHVDVIATSGTVPVYCLMAIGEVFPIAAKTLGDKLPPTGVTEDALSEVLNDLALKIRAENDQLDALDRQAFRHRHPVVAGALCGFLGAAVVAIVAPWLAAVVAIVAPWLATLVRAWLSYASFVMSLTGAM